MQRTSKEPHSAAPTGSTESLQSLVYVSSATHLFGENELAQLLAHARARNHAAGITGLLLYCEGNFMQALEGPAQAVAEAFTRIGRDSRHHGVTQLSLHAIPGREFAGWDMAYNATTAPEFLALSQAGWAAEASARGDRPASRGRKMLRDFWTACRRT